jgi:oligopeptide/dipeptide ABC transporter ATP-binding protein
VNAPPESARPILSVRDLSVGYATEKGTLRAVDHVSFDIPRGRAVAIVGESGSGKSSIAYALMRLLPEGAGSILGGTIEFEGRDLLPLSERAMREVRGARMAMVFQDAMTALDPVYTIGAQISEAYRLHRAASRSEARRRAIELLRRVGLPEPDRRIDDYPHELSGGMRQRVLLATALAADPALLIADEPTSALDVTIQAQIIELLARLKEELGMSLLLIAHDLTVVSGIADEILVLYAGEVVERGPTARVLSEPRHPYTIALLRSVPPRDIAARKYGERGRRLPTIPGAPPDLSASLRGCRFAPRCSVAFARCEEEAPGFFSTATSAEARCFLFAPAAESVSPSRPEDAIPLSTRARRPLDSSSGEAT